MKNKQIVINFTEEFWFGFWILIVILFVGFSFGIIVTEIYNSGFDNGYGASVRDVINWSETQDYIEYKDPENKKEVRLYTYDGCPEKTDRFVWGYGNGGNSYNPFWQNGSIRIINQGDMR